MSELKACPFCGVVGGEPHKPECYLIINVNKIIREKMPIHMQLDRYWNNRPIEDALRSRFDKLELLRRTHDICDDCWYSCPKSNNGENDWNYCGPKEYTECNCGADKHNKILDEIIAELKAVLL